MSANQPPARPYTFTDAWLDVTLLNGQTRYYKINLSKGWKIDPTNRTIVLLYPEGKEFGPDGSCINRTVIPLDNVESWSVRHVDKDGA